MNIEVAIREISKDMGAPGFRAAYGQWTPYSWVVRGLVEQGYNVLESVREVVHRAGLTPEKLAMGGIRTAYYRNKDLPWPKDMAKYAVQQASPEAAEAEQAAYAPEGYDFEKDFEV